MYKIVEFSHKLIADHLQHLNKVPITAVDATCGMGKDTIYMAHLLQNNGHVYSYDIQQVAIDIAKQYAAKANLYNITFYLQSHEKIVQTNIDCIIYNLGYLPTADKAITTNVTSTLTSIQTMLILMESNPDMLMIVVVYPGHEAGKQESECLDEYLKQLPSQQFLVSKYENYNRPNAPYLYAVCLDKKMKR